jgi:hypothetical protein
VEVLKRALPEPVQADHSQIVDRLFLGSLDGVVIQVIDEKTRPLPNKIIIFLGSKVRRVRRRVDNLTAIYEPIV